MKRDIPAVIEAGGLIPEGHHKELTRKRRAGELAVLRTERNALAIALVVSLAVALLTVVGWMRADDRFANNVRVAWVKLSPNGTYQVEWSDEGKGVQAYASTVESKLTEWVQRRFSKMRHTIGVDYGFARMFMSEKLSTQFMTEFNAPKVAAEMVSCTTCDEIEVTVRNLDSIDKDILPGKKKEELFTTLAFVVERKIDPDGRVTGCQNKIITLYWKFRPVAETASRKKELTANPLGQEFDRYSVRDDPTPVSAEDCAKRS